MDNYERMESVNQEIHTEDKSNSRSRKTMEDLAHANIPGWGADLDEANRPAYPKERTPPRLDVPWSKPEQQPLVDEVLLSVEYPEMRPVYGTSVTPSGLSGAIRRMAFKRSENDIRHWLMLLFADRLNVVEGIVEDIAEGHIPNIFAEMGWKAKFKYDRKNAILKSLAIAGVVGFVGYRLFGSRRDRDR